MEQLNLKSFGVDDIAELKEYIDRLYVAERLHAGYASKYEDMGWDAAHHLEELKEQIFMAKPLTRADVKAVWDREMRTYTEGWGRNYKRKDLYIQRLKDSKKLFLDIGQWLIDGGEVVISDGITSVTYGKIRRLDGSSHYLEVQHDGEWRRRCMDGLLGVLASNRMAPGARQRTLTIEWY